MERARFARGKVTGRRGHSTNLVRILWLVDIIALDFIQTHLKVRQFNLCRALFISRGPQTGKLMYKRIYMIALDFKFTFRSRGVARDFLIKKSIARIDLTASACDEID